MNGDLLKQINLKWLNANAKPMDINTIYNEPCLDTLNRMPSNFLDCVVTSPPYWQLRDYGYEGQWGLEPTYQLYLEHLWSMMDEIYRCLKPEGTCWINLGDTYSTQVPTKPSSSEHYASYNDFLLKKPVLAGCPVGGIIYDPFMGTGSTAEVALRSDRYFIGSEMSTDYQKIAEQRLKPFLMQQTLF